MNFCHCAEVGESCEFCIKPGKKDCYLAHIGHLRMALKEFLAKYPCQIKTPECHCESCVAEHALAVTGGFKP